MNKRKAILVAALGLAAVGIFGVTALATPGAGFSGTTPIRGTFTEPRVEVTCYFSRCDDFSFSRQISSASSVSTTIACFSLTVHGFVYAFMSSTVTSISR